MQTCPNCGAGVPDHAKFCTACGARLAPTLGERAKGYWNKLNDTADDTAAYTISDIDNHKIISIFAYLGVFVLIPFFAAKRSPFARYHTNQGMLLLLVNILLGLTQLMFDALLPSFVENMLDFPFALCHLALFVFAVIGIFHVIQGRAKALPLIGHLTLIK